MLLFNADILSAVYYRFSGNQFDYLLDEINKYLPKNQKMFVDPFRKGLAKVVLSDNTELMLLLKKDGNTGLKHYIKPK